MRTPVEDCVPVSTAGADLSPFLEHPHEGVPRTKVGCSQAEPLVSPVPCLPLSLQQDDGEGTPGSDTWGHRLSAVATPVGRGLRSSAALGAAGPGAYGAVAPGGLPCGWRVPRRGTATRGARAALQAVLGPHVPPRLTPMPGSPVLRGRASVQLPAMPRSAKDTLRPQTRPPDSPTT